MKIGGDPQVASGRIGGAMGQNWHPSYWGKQATKCNDWALTLDADDLSLEGDGNAFNTSIGVIGDVQINRGALWSTIEISHTQRRIRLRGIPNRRARILRRDGHLQ